MNPAPGLLDDWLSLGAYFWLVLAITAVTWVLAYAVRGWLKTGRRIDADPPRLLTDYYVCDLETCDQIATTVLDAPHGGYLLICDEHVGVVRGWIG